MTREHARVKLSIWDDDDFRALSPAAQHLYMVLMIHPKLDYVGVTDWRPGRLAQFAAGWSSQGVEIAAQELSETLFIVIDTESEEVLLRSFIRNDELLESPNMAVAMCKAHTSVASAPLRAIVVHELNRLRKDEPDLKGWSKVTDLLDRASLNPSEYPSFTPSPDPSGDPSPNGSGDHPPNPSGSPSGNPSVIPSVTTAPNSKLPTPSSKTKRTEDQDWEGKRSETLRARGATKPPQQKPSDEPACSKHPSGNLADEACSGCAKVREHRDKAAERRMEKDRLDLEECRRNCTICEGTGKVLDENKLPTRRTCDHRTRTTT